MRIYLAAAYARRPEILELSKRFEERGHTVTSRWIHGDHDLPKGVEAGSHEHLAWGAAEDLEDIDRSGCVVSFTGGGTTGGRHVEFGYAIARGKRLIVVGEPENVFHHLPYVERVDSVESALSLLGSAGD